VSLAAVAGTALVMPELQHRGLFRTGYASRTLRGHLGLPRPRSRWAAQSLPMNLTMPLTC